MYNASAIKAFTMLNNLSSVIFSVNILRHRWRTQCRERNNGSLTRDNGRSPTLTSNRSQTSRGHRIRLELLHCYPPSSRPTSVTAPLSRLDFRGDSRRQI